MILFLKKKSFYPILMVITISLIFYFKNGTNINDLFSSLVLAIFLLLIIWVVSYLLLRDINKSAVFSLISAGILFTYQNTIYFIARTFIKLNLKSLALYCFTHAGQWLYFLISLLLLVALFILVNKIDRIRDSITLYLNIFCVFFLVYAGAVGIINQNKDRALRNDFTNYWRAVINSQVDQNTDGTGEENPDIYYIILDGFSRSDTLLRLYDLDNSKFINDLRSYGFYVADNSNANYTQTRTSLASSLNMIYLDEVSEMLDTNPSRVFPAYYMISNSTVESQLRILDYETVAFRSEAGFLDFIDWDEYYAPVLVPNNYIQTFMSSTAISVFVDSLRYKWHDSLLNYNFEKIPQAGAKVGSQFVFAHFYSPHPPFVYDKNGSIVHRNLIYSTVDATHLKVLFSDQDFFAYYKEGYKNQIIYLQKNLLSLVENIKKNSTQPFVIILQGDHGSGMFFDHDNLENSDIKERLGILNAIYFSDEDYQNLYPEISPVNTFRVIFSQYFGMNFPLLEDRHYYTTFNELFEFIPVDDRLN